MEVPSALMQVNGLCAAVRILLAAIAGGLIGMEREKHGRAAGLRTHILVSVGSALAMLAGLYAAEVLGLDTDPTRMAAQVISGIGFLGAGTILVRRNTHITGLTTAASLWATAAIGLAVGIGFYAAALAATAVVFVTVSALARFELKRGRGKMYYIELDSPGAINGFFDAFSAKEYTLRIVPARSKTAGYVGIELEYAGLQDSGRLLAALRGTEHVAAAIPAAE